jgi:hypothetical protein
LRKTVKPVQFGDGVVTDSGLFRRLSEVPGDPEPAYASWECIDWTGYPRGARPSDIIINGVIGIEFGDAGDFLAALEAGHIVEWQTDVFSAPVYDINGRNIAKAGFFCRTDLPWRSEPAQHQHIGDSSGKHEGLLNWDSLDRGV